MTIQRFPQVFTLVERMGRVSITAIIASLLLPLSSWSQNYPDMVDKATAFRAVQTIYRRGVPHTDKQGRLLMKYDPERSFFQIGIWGNPYGDKYGHNYDLNVLKNAGMNTMWPWFSSVEKQLEAGKQAGLQVVIMGQIEQNEAEKFKKLAEIEINF